MTSFLNTDWAAMTATDWLGLVMTVVIFILMGVVYWKVFGPSGKSMEEAKYLALDDEQVRGGRADHGK